MTTRPSRSRESGTVTLVALCFVAVVGIALASYITVCTRAMTLSNRSFQQNLSNQIAEMAMEEALRAINTNNWDDWSSGSITADWSFSGTTATCTITFPSTQFGQGTSATATVRVDNYNTYHAGETWDSTTNYRINDLVGHSGIWYRCVQNHSNQTPNGMANLAYWVPAPIPWQWQPNFSYRLYEVVNYNGTWYRCTTAHTSGSTWSATNWTSIGAIRLYNAANSHTTGDIVYYPDTTTWYRCTASGTPGSFSGTAQFFWQYVSTQTYRFNDVVCYYTGGNYNWYRYINATSTSGNLPTNTTYWENSLTGSMWDWSSSENYSLGDVVYRSGSWYRCIREHLDQGPPNTTYWSADPAKPHTWQPGKSYSQYATVYHRGNWYLSLTSANVGNNPAFSSSNWAVAPREAPAWSSTTIYHTDDIVAYSGTWYRCIQGHLNQTPPSANYWVAMAGTSYQWSAATAYTAGSSYVNYGGVWYRCAVSHTNRSPNNSTYWTALGTVVAYGRGTITYADGSTSSTQLRGLVAPGTVFPNAVGASTTLTVTSGTSTIDSYDASVHSQTTAGTPSALTYDSTASPFGASSPNRGYAATVAAANTSGTPLLLAGTPTVHGYLAAHSSTTSPYAPLYSLNASTSLTNPDGSVTSPHATAASVDLTRVSRSPYVPTPDPIPTPLSTAFSSFDFPYGRAIPAPSATAIYLGHPGATTPARYYYNATITLSAGRTIYVVGPTILFVNGNLQTSGTGQIIITATGSLELHLDSRLRIEAGSNGIINQTQDPKRLVIIADVSSTSTQYYNSAVNDFYGIIYMPNTTASVGLSIGTGVEIYGALSAREVTFAAEATLHYDTSLLHHHVPGIDQPYTLSQLRELTTAAEKVAF